MEIGREDGFHRIKRNKQTNKQHPENILIFRIKTSEKYSGRPLILIINADDWKRRSNIL